MRSFEVAFSSPPRCPGSGIGQQPYPTALTLLLEEPDRMCVSFAFADAESRSLACQSCVHRMVESVNSVTPQVQVYAPAQSLRDHITFYYFVVAPGPVDDFLYPEWGNVRFALSGDWRLEMAGYGPEPQKEVLFGPTDHCARVTTSGGTCAGFGLTPLGWVKLIGEDADAMRNRVRTLTHEFDGSLNAVRLALIDGMTDATAVDRLDQILLDLMAERSPPPPQLVALDHALRDRPATVHEFADAVGISARTLQRLCLKLFGFAPKRLIRRQRFLDTLGKFRTAVGESLQISMDAAYFDEAHFYRDFRDFMGMSPRAYFAASRDLMARAAAAQSAAGVTLSFKLPPD